MPAILFPRRVLVSGIVSWLPDRISCSAFSPSPESNGTLLQESPVTVAGPLRNRTAFRVSRNGQLVVVVAWPPRSVNPITGQRTTARIASTIDPEKTKMVV